MNFGYILGRGYVVINIILKYMSTGFRLVCRVESSFYLTMINQERNNGFGLRDKHKRFTLPEHLRSTPVFGWVRVAQSLVFYVMSTIICLFLFYFQPWRCQFFFSINEFDCLSGIFRFYLANNINLTQKIVKVRCHMHSQPYS